MLAPSFPTLSSRSLALACLHGRHLCYCFIIRTDQSRGIEHLCCEKHTQPVWWEQDSHHQPRWLKDSGALWRCWGQGSLRVRTQRRQSLTLTCFWNVRRPWLCTTGQKRACGTRSQEFQEYLPSLLIFAVYFRPFYFKWCLLSAIWLFKWKKLKCSKYLIRGMVCFKLNLNA